MRGYFDKYFFNPSGRFEYPGCSHPYHEQVRNYFQVISPNKSNEYFYNKLKLVWGNLFDFSFEEFNNEIEEISKKIDSDNLKNIQNSISPLPVFIPRFEFENHIDLLIENYLPKLKFSFTNENPEYNFSIYNIPNNRTKIVIEKSSNYEKLLEAAKFKPYIGLFFPVLMNFLEKAALQCFKLYLIILYLVEELILLLL